MFFFKTTSLVALPDRCASASRFPTRRSCPWMTSKQSWDLSFNRSIQAESWQRIHLRKWPTHDCSFPKWWCHPENFSDFMAPWSWNIDRPFFFLKSGFFCICLYYMMWWLRLHCRMCTSTCLKSTEAAFLQTSSLQDLYLTVVEAFAQWQQGHWASGVGRPSCKC